MSPFTRTQLQGSYFYVGIIVIFAGIFVYFWLFKTPSAKQVFHEQAFVMVKQALENSIKMANAKYLARSNKQQYLDVWQINDIGLDYNQQGYPTGTHLDIASITNNITLQGCIEVWDFLLGKLHPLSLTPNQNQYWASLDLMGQCHYLTLKVPDKEIIYSSISGKVDIAQVNSAN